MKRKNYRCYYGNCGNGRIVKIFYNIIVYKRTLANKLHLGSIQNLFKNSGDKW